MHRIHEILNKIPVKYCRIYICGLRFSYKIFSGGGFRNLPGSVRQPHIRGLCEPEACADAALYQALPGQHSQVLRASLQVLRRFI
jgi:hypothetical protein